MPGSVSGRMMRRKTVKGAALSVIAASRSCGGMLFSMYTTGPAASMV